MNSAARAAYRDARDGLGLWRAWVRLAYGSVLRPYRNTVIGPIWEPLGLLMLLALLGPLYAHAFGRSVEDYVLYLGAGWTVWHLISGCLTQGAGALQQAGGLLSQSRLPVSLFFLRVTAVEIIEFALKLVVILALIAVLGKPLRSEMLLVLPGFALLLFNCLGLVVLVSLTCVRFPDVRPLVAIVTRLAFFVTPILWDAQMLIGDEDSLGMGGRRGIALLFIDMNPLYHLLELVRAPLLGDAPQALSWNFSLGFAAAIWIVGILLFVRWRPRVVYWT